MKKQEVPKIVAEVLKQVSEKISGFNSNFNNDFKLVAKSSDSFSLKIYPKNYESLFFKIHSYQLANSNDLSKILNVTFYISTNYDSYNSIIKELNKSGILNFDKPISVNQLYISLDEYLSTINNLVIKLNSYEKTTLNISEFFDIEDDEEEILPPEPNHFESADKILPYSLKQLAVKDFQGIKELSVESIPVDTQWIFLVGENGFGKSTVLQAIFIGLNGALDGNTPLLENKHSSIQVEYKSLEDSFVNSIKDNKNPLVHLAAYGPGRLNVQGVKSENAEDRNNSVSYNLFNSDGFLFNINSELVRWSLKEDQRFGLVKKAICTLIPNLADVRLNPDTDQIEYIEQEIGSDGKNTIKYQPLPFQKLASGFKSVIALAGDMIVRLSKNQPTVKDPSELKGIVIIDEIDLHLHPKLQKQLVGQFSKVFPKVQFIVSTHSPIPLLGAASNTVILKVSRTEAEGVQIENIKLELKNLTPNLVLTSGIFDMEDFVSAQNDNISEVRTEDSFDEMQKNDMVEKHLQDFEKSANQFPDELFMPKSLK
jgi:predicted ATP-binding protein involved in virulence